MNSGAGDGREGDILSSQGKSVVYLKFNTLSPNALRSLCFWIEVFAKVGHRIFILCDLDLEVLKRIFSERFLHLVIPSYGELRQILSTRLDRKWVNAGAAHLTTFLHAKTNGIAHYWNIDADDTLFFHDTTAVAQKTLEIQSYADAEKLDCFSLDMYHTLQRHWSFGITYTRMQDTDYFGLIDRIRNDDLLAAYPPKYDAKPALVNGAGDYYPGFQTNQNIDWYFTYLRDSGRIKAKSFYVEDAYFAHFNYHCVDPIGLLVNGVYHWKDGKLWDRPIADDCIGFPRFAP